MLYSCTHENSGRQRVTAILATRHVGQTIRVVKQRERLGGGSESAGGQKKVRYGEGIPSITGVKLEVPFLLVLLKIRLLL